METTIDKAQSNLRNIQRYYIKADNETIDFAIDILRKYQKITQIAKEWEFDHESMVESMEKISEVIKNG